MQKINLKTTEIYSGTYNADNDQWELSVDAGYDVSIPLKASISEDGDTYWNCYLVSVKLDSGYYDLVYRDF